MDIKTLESLGITPETLADRIVDQAVDALLNSKGFDPDGEQEVRYESQFKKAIHDKLTKAVDEKISALAAEHLVPRVGEMIEKADMRKTNNWGEAKSEPMTFKEYLAHRAEAYMSEPVNSNGLSKDEDDNSYNWRSCGPRLTVLMKRYIKEEMEKAASHAVSDINKKIAEGMKKAACDAISSVSQKLTVSVTA